MGAVIRGIGIAGLGRGSWLCVEMDVSAVCFSPSLSLLEN